MDASEEDLELRPNPALLRFVDGGGRPAGRWVAEGGDPTPTDQPSPLVDIGNDVPGTDFP